ncbi:MAG TPA: MBL fold metallo-hydrolase [Candidatus Dormibacteraeota bacterium]|jgi:glyoxylase-like metal-dependent hydrolase (beta-lactamase superfamily II)
MLVGDLRIDPVADGMARVAPSEAYAGTGDDAWAPHREFLAGDGMLELELGGFLVRGGGHTVLVDCGLGPLSRGGFEGGRLLDSLAALGVAAADVTDLVFTHLHFDHVGWATQKGAVVFVNAVPRCDRRDWAHFVTGPDGGAARKLTPLADRVAFWEAGSTVLPGIDVLHAPGHTPGSSIVVVSSGTERALLLGDVVHCPVELVDDEWAGMGDVDPALAQRTRAALIREIEGGDVPVAAAHFPGLRFGRLLRGEGRRRWQF